MFTSNSWDRILPSTPESEWAGSTLEPTAGQIPRDHSAPISKRTLDVALALAGLALLSPLLVAIAIAVKLDSTGPILYVSRRLCRNGRLFGCLKFRTMAEGKVTRVASVLRRYGLDELPQLINALRGEMSVVGPRPVTASDVPGQELRHFRRFELKPGITGLWAMHQLEWAQGGSYIAPDETYRNNWSVWLDLVIVMRSVLAALVGREH